MRRGGELTAPGSNRAVAHQALTTPAEPTKPGVGVHEGELVGAKQVLDEEATPARPPRAQPPCAGAGDLELLAAAPSRSASAGSSEAGWA